VSGSNGSVNPLRRYPAPGFARLLSRGLRRRCPRCGGGGLFSRYFAMLETCPTCDYRFETAPQEGSFFLGALTINMGVALTTVLLAMFAYIVMLAANGGEGPPLVPFLPVAGLLTLLLPIVFYPYARTLWAAIDYGLHHEDRKPGSLH
jgi:uncharacterized protein (DUF983 family)